MKVEHAIEHAKKARAEGLRGVFPLATQALAEEVFRLRNALEEIAKPMRDDEHPNDYAARLRYTAIDALGKVGAGETATVTRAMICAAHGVTLESGDVVLSARLLERIYTAMAAAAKTHNV